MLVVAENNLKHIEEEDCYCSVKKNLSPEVVKKITGDDFFMPSYFQGNVLTTSVFLARRLCNQ